jgi:adenylosuccinate synthase
MANLVVIGAQWGDEGKGKVVDILAEFSDMVVRFQGGSNAGHTLLVDGKPLVLHQVPSGVLHPAKRCVIGAGVVLDPEALVAEIEALQQRGLLAGPATLTISHRAHVVMPYHKLLDAAREASRGAGKIGTTLRGIGPCMEDKASRAGIRVTDLLDGAALSDKLSQRLPEVNAVLAHHGREPVREPELRAQLGVWATRLAPFIGDDGELVRQEMARGRNILFEGAQGTLLDVDHGTYPFVTSSNTVAGAACVGVGFGPGRINGVVGVTKAYSTRVGEGPFPTELKDERGLKLQEKGTEFGSTTGRPRRCGWLDLAALRYTVALNGCTSLCLTKLDVLGGLGPIRACVGYRLDGAEVQSFPADVRAVGRLEPIYEEMEGWEEDLGGIRELEALPAAARRFLDRIENLLHVPIDMISVGAGRAATIMVRNPFRVP